METKRANTATELKDAGLEQYLEPTQIGTIIGTLDYKMWGRSKNIWSFFTLEGGSKIKLSAFRYDTNTKSYCARDQKYNFSLVGNEGKKFKLTIGKTSKDTISWEEAELI